MNAGVAIKIDTEGDSEEWFKLLTALGVDEVYELPGLGVPMPGSIMVENLTQVGNFRPGPLIVVQPKNADFIKGEKPLLELEHPDDAIYVFGGTITRLNRADVAGATITQSVYIDTDGDLYPAQAGAIVLWDRYLKAHW